MLTKLIILNSPLALFGPNGNVTVSDSGNGQRITYWEDAVLGPEPEWDEATQTYPALEAHRDKVKAEEIAAENARLYPDAPMWQVKVWMVRNGIDLASIPGIMAASIPAGPQLQEALVRWETAPLVPYDNALVGLIAGALNISKELAWSEIRAI